MSECGIEAHPNNGQTSTLSPGRPLCLEEIIGAELGGIYESSLYVSLLLTGHTSSSREPETPEVLLTAVEIDVSNSRSPVVAQPTDHILLVYSETRLASLGHRLDGP